MEFCVNRGVVGRMNIDLTAWTSQRFDLKSIETLIQTGMAGLLKVSSHD